MRLLASTAIVSAIICASSCFSSRPDEPIAIDTFPIEQDLPEVDKPVDDECNIDEIKCSKEEMIREDIVCITRGFGAHVFVKGWQPQGWGSSICEAKRSLTRVLCDQKVSPSAVDRFQCLPDPSSGHCPAKPEKCPDTEKLQTCTTTSYMDQKLDKQKILKSWGKNRCDAMNELRALACRQGMDPSLLSQVSCRVIPEIPEDCPPKIKACDRPYAATTCKIRRYNGEPLAQMLTVSANSLCEAQAQAYFLACQRDLLPSKLGTMDCNPEIRRPPAQGAK